MAKVKIQGHASGTGILTVTAPNTSTDRTITLPDATGTLATTADTFDPDGAVTINDTGADVDFRVEGSGAANALFVQGSDGNVGIGTNAPAMASGSYNGLHIGATYPTMKLSSTATGHTATDGFHLRIDSTPRVEHWNYENSSQVFATNNAARLEITADGKVKNEDGIYKIGTQTDATADGWNFESSGATMISCAQDTAVKIGNVRASGFIIINDTTVTGQAGVIVTGGGVISIVGQTASQFVSSSTPSTSQVGIYNAGGYVTIKNGKSSTIGMSLITFRTRTNQ